LNYFEEFGPSGKLLRIIELYDTYNGKKIIKKDKCNLPIQIVQKYAASETEKQYRFTDESMQQMLTELISIIPDTDIPLQKRLESEIEYLGYASTVIPEAEYTAAVMNLDVKYSPKLQLYDIGTGETLTVKLAKKSFQMNPLCVGNIINYRTERRNGWKKAEDGSWQQDSNKQELWLTYYAPSTQYT
jgi:hypothetical protein